MTGIAERHAGVWTLHSPPMEQDRINPAVSVALEAQAIPSRKPLTSFVGFDWNRPR